LEEEVLDPGIILLGLEKAIGLEDLREYCGYRTWRRWNYLRDTVSGALGLKGPGSVTGASKNGRGKAVTIVRGGGENHRGVLISVEERRWWVDVDLVFRMVGVATVRFLFLVFKGGLVSELRFEFGKGSGRADMPEVLMIVSPQRVKSIEKDSGESRELTTG
jgi:hypothetical protein